MAGTCDKCNAQGWVMVDGQKTKCPRCHGKGTT